MLIKKIPKYLQGTVKFELKGNGIISLLNMCSRNGIELFRVEFSENGATANCTVSDYKKIQKIKEKSVRRKILKKKGLRFFTYRYRKRLGFFTGMILMTFLLIFLSGFVWSVDVSGNERLSSNVIINSLREYGFSAGKRKSSFNITEIENKMKTEFYDISWISINLDGSSAHVEIKERYLIPPYDDTSRPSNLVASSDGQIIKMEITKGKPIAMKGSGVCKGELLVTGSYLDKKENPILEHSSGKVTAEVEISKAFEVSMKYSKKTESKSKVFYSAVFFEKKLNISFGKRPEMGEWVLKEKENCLNIFGLRFPFKIIESTYTKDVYTDVVRSFEEAKKVIKLEIEHFEKSQLYEAEIIKKNIVWKEDKENSLCAVVDYVVATDIAQQQYIEAEN